MVMSPGDREFHESMMAARQRQRQTATLVEVLSIPVTEITSDPSKLRVLLRMRHHPSVEQRDRLNHYVTCWLAGAVQTLVLTDDAELSFVLLDGPEPIIVEAK